MKIKNKISYMVSSFIVSFFVIYFYSVPLYGEEPYSSSGKIKGMFEVDVSTSISSRRVVEETSPGVNFSGDAESTRVMTRIATRPWRPVELYLQAGTSNLVISEFNDFRGDYKAAYGGGVALTFYEKKGPRPFQLVMKGDVLNFTTSDNILTTIGGSDVFVQEDIHWREYTIDSVGMWWSQYWEPYLGARFSFLDSQDNIKDPRVGRLTLKEDSNLGIVMGTNLYFDPRENFALNLEATLIDQASLKIALKRWF